MGKSQIASGSRTQQSPNGGPVQLTAEAKVDFATRVAKRDDILQVNSAPALLHAPTDLVVTRDIHVGRDRKITATDYHR